MVLQRNGGGRGDGRVAEPIAEHAAGIVEGLARLLGVGAPITKRSNAFVAALWLIAAGCQPEQGAPPVPTGTATRAPTATARPAVISRATATPVLADTQPPATSTPTPLPSATPRLLPIPASALEPCVEGIPEPHGLGLDLAGLLYVSSVADRAVYQVDLRTKEQRLFTGGLDFAHDLRPGEEGNLYAPVVNDGLLVRLAPDGTPSVIADGLPGANGLALSPAGSWYVSNYFAHTVVEVAPDGAQRTVLNNLAGPSGLVFDREGNLYVANYEDPTRAVLKLTPGGQAGVAVGGLTHAESLALDDGGNLYIGHGVAGIGQVSRLTPDGRLEPFLLTPLPGPIVGPIFTRDGTLVLHSASGRDDTIYCVPGAGS